jgi:hypothetical protein
MVQRHDVPHGAEPDAPRPCAGRDGIEAGRGHPALVGPEMMLDAEPIVEAELVGELQLTPQLVVALSRRHPSLVPDMREMSEFHEALPL